MFGIHVMAVCSFLQKAYTVLPGTFLGPDFTNLCFVCLKAWVVNVWKDIHSRGLGFIVYKMQVVICPEQNQKRQVKKRHRQALLP